MISYAGIGSRTITDRESAIIQKVASELSKKDLVLYSGNASGSDINFQIGSNSKCVIFLPWKDFNNQEYHVSRSLKSYVVGDTQPGLHSVQEFHPNPSSLSRGGKSLMARNYHQVVGYDTFPQVSFVICCANYKSVDNMMQVDGGTGQAVRIANSKNIPVVNIRSEHWLEKLKKLV
jgi:hypothetical protein